MAARKRKNRIPSTSALGSNAVLNLPAGALTPAAPKKPKRRAPKPSNTITGETYFPAQPKDPLAGNVINPNGVVSKPKPKKPWTAADLDAYQRKNKKGKYAPKPGAKPTPSPGGSAPSAPSGGVPASNGSKPGSPASTAKAKREARRARLAERKAARRAEDQTLNAWLQAETGGYQSDIRQEEAQLRGDLSQTNRLFGFQNQQMSDLARARDASNANLLGSAAASAQSQGADLAKSQDFLKNLLGGQTTNESANFLQGTQQAQGQGLAAQGAAGNNLMQAIQASLGSMQRESGQQRQNQSNAFVQERKSLINAKRAELPWQRYQMQAERDKQNLAARIAGVEAQQKADQSAQGWARIGLQGQSLASANANRAADRALRQQIARANLRLRSAGGSKDPFKLSREQRAQTKSLMDYAFSTDSISGERARYEAPELLRDQYDDLSFDNLIVHLANSTSSSIPTATNFAMTHYSDLYDKARSKGYSLEFDKSGRPYLAKKKK